MILNGTLKYYVMLRKKPVFQQIAKSCRRTSVAKLDKKSTKQGIGTIQLTLALLYLTKCIQKCVAQFVIKLITYTQRTY